jgi:RNA polymerase-binding transcription factor DksA
MATTKKPASKPVKNAKASGSGAKAAPPKGGKSAASKSAPQAKGKVVAKKSTRPSSVKASPAKPGKKAAAPAKKAIPVKSAKKAVAKPSVKAKAAPSKTLQKGKPVPAAKKGAAKPPKPAVKAPIKKQKTVNSKTTKTVASKSAPSKTIRPAAVKTAAKAAPAKKAAPAAKKPEVKTTARPAATTKATAAKAAPAKAAPAKPTAKAAPVKATAVKSAPAGKAASAKAAPAPELKKAPEVKAAPLEKPAKAPKAPKAPKPPKPLKAGSTGAAKYLASVKAASAPNPISRPAPSRIAREEKKPNIIIAHRRKDNKSAGADDNRKTMINYQPDYTRSILDTAAQQSGPVYRYSDEELNEFKELITNRLETARKELNYLQGLITRKDEAGTEDTENRYMNMEDGSGAMEREQLAQLASRQIQFINHLEKAMIRIENKTYGICRVTGKLIDKARLRAVPHATLSIEAKKTMSK